MTSKIGKDTVVIGKVPAGTSVGDRSVVIGPTDGRGNVKLNKTMAVGYGANAGPGSVAIGAFANAGGSLHAHLVDLDAFVAEHADEPAKQQWARFREELDRDPRQPGAVMKAWETVKAAGSLNGAHDLLEKISTGLELLLP